MDITDLVFELKFFKPIHEMADYLESVVEKDKTPMVNLGFIRLMDLTWCIGVVTGFVIMIFTQMFMVAILS